MDKFDRFREVVAKLRAKDGCPWDREQTHESLKAPCIEEACEVVCGINILNATGNAENLKEELGDLLFQVMIHAQIAEEEGLFRIEDVIDTVTDKMIRRHPHVFGDVSVSGSDEVIKNWDEIKSAEKIGKTDEKDFIFNAFDESAQLIDVAKERKLKKLASSK